MTAHSANLKAWRQKLEVEQDERAFGTCKVSEDNNWKVVVNSYGEKLDWIRERNNLPKFGQPRWGMVCEETSELRDLNRISLQLGISARFIINCMFDYYLWWAKRSNGPPKEHFAVSSKIQYAIEQVTGCPRGIQKQLFSDEYIIQRGTQLFKSSYKAIEDLLKQTGNTEQMQVLMDIDTLALPACVRFCYNPDLYKKEPWRKQLIEEISIEMDDDRVLLKWITDIGWTFGSIVDYLNKYE